LKPPKIIASFTTRASVKTTLETCIISKRYQFLRFYVKYIPKLGKLIFGLLKSSIPKMHAGSHCIGLAKMNPMMQESLKSKPACGTYGPLKITDG
jgi:hypothetical protein